MKILFLPMDATGHVNSCIGLARMLQEYGHQSTFVVPKRWSKEIEPYNFAVETVSDCSEDSDDVDVQQKWALLMNKHPGLFAKTPKEQYAEIAEPATRVFIEYTKAIDDQLPDLIDQLNPDLIIVDFYVTVPSVVNSGRPWILLFSANPLRAYSEPHVPPSGFGLSVDTDPAISMELKMYVMGLINECKVEFDEWLVSKGVEPYPFDVMSPSPFLNVYSFPSDLDYTELGPIPDKWFRLDHMVRKVQDGPLGFDESFFERPGKKILLSLGSMGGSDVTLMKRLVDILGQSSHQFIVSKGVFHEDYDLPDNMVGGKYINQMDVIPRVDLVITHGGNNTFVETFYFGKPAIVLPLFADQHDNGRRVEDKKLGRSFPPYSVTADELLTAIDEILEDAELIDKIAQISENIRNSNSIDEFNTKIEEIVANSNNNNGPESD